jgi:hypothetical protein
MRGAHRRFLLPHHSEQRGAADGRDLCVRPCGTPALNLGPQKLTGAARAALFAMHRRSAWDCV